MQPNFRNFIAVLILSAFFWVPAVSASQIVLITKNRNSDELRQQVQNATRFYGLELVELNLANGTIDIARTLAQPQVAGVVLAADTIPFIHRRDLLQWLSRPNRGSVSVLVAGLTSSSSAEALREWSGGRVEGAYNCPSPSRVAVLHVDKVEHVSAELGDQDLPLFSSDRSCLKATSSSTLRPVTEIVDGSNRFPIFVEDVTAKIAVFFLAQTPRATLPPSKSISYLPAVFSQWAAPYLMFTRAVAGDTAWHFSGKYANFTVDDPWLIEPYGRMSYASLLAEMEKHQFHTTVAFIPWNFDRSRADVVSLILNHPKQFSVCPHGDDHSHTEFALSAPHYDYSEQARQNDTFRIRQALARMNEFSRQTKIPYDRVWIFPHVIGPEPVLGLLKENGFLATTNSEAVPQGVTPPADPLFRFNNVTLEYENFPSIRRYAADGGLTSTFLAIQSFLGNPILLYAHQDFFASGMGAFDSLADQINQLNPNVTWTSLGEVVRRNYLIKRRDDGQFDVRALSNELAISNPDSRDRVFNVVKQESFRPTVRTVIVDGQPVPYEREGSSLTTHLVIPAGGTRLVTVNYDIPQDLGQVSISRSNLRSDLLRGISDFRDLVIARSRLGVRLTTFYYREIDPEKVGGYTRLYALVAGLVAVVLGFAIAIWRIRKVMARGGRRVGNRNQPASAKVVP